MAVNKKLEADIILNDNKFLSTLDKIENKVKMFQEQVEKTWSEVDMKWIKKFESEIDKIESRIKALKKETEWLWENVKTWWLKWFFSTISWWVSDLITSWLWKLWLGWWALAAWTAIATFWYQDLTDQEQILKKANLEMWREKALLFSQTIEDIRKQKPELTRWQIAEANTLAFQTWIFSNATEAMSIWWSLAELQSLWKDTTQIVKAISSVKKTYKDANTKDILQWLLTLEQNWANLSDDLYDTFWEYSTQFQKSWMTLNESFWLVESMMKNWAFNTDKVWDLVKENILRIQDLFWENWWKWAEALFKWTWLDIQAIKSRITWVWEAKASEEIINSIKSLSKSEQQRIMFWIYWTQAEDLWVNTVFWWFANKSNFVTNEQILSDLNLKWSAWEFWQNVSDLKKWLYDVSATIVWTIWEWLWYQTYEQKIWWKTTFDKATETLWFTNRRYDDKVLNQTININSKITQDEAQKIAKQNNLSTPK